MRMHNPPHPGEVLKALCLEPLGLTITEAAQALGKMLAARPGTVEERATYLFRRCLTRPPAADEVRLLAAFYANQKTRLEKKELDAAAIAGPGENADDSAAWTLLARSLLNLDETITKE